MTQEKPDIYRFRREVALSLKALCEDHATRAFAGEQAICTKEYVGKVIDAVKEFAPPEFRLAAESAAAGQQLFLREKTEDITPIECGMVSGIYYNMAFSLGLVLK